MSGENLDPVTRLSVDECWQLLDGSRPARLAFTAGGIIDIVPVNYVSDGRTLLFRTSEGNKLLGVTANPHIAFETDGRDGDEVHSIVVRGTATVLEKQDEKDHAETLGLKPWLPTLKYVWVRIVPETITGIRFTVADEPERF